jgi:hypothetical protein
MKKSFSDAILLDALYRLSDNQDKFPAESKQQQKDYTLLYDFIITQTCTHPRFKLNPHSRDKKCTTCGLITNDNN